MSYIDVVGVTKVFAVNNRLRIVAVRRMDLEIARGEVFGLVGESGSGKSTLAKMIIGLMAPSQGYIQIDGKSLKDLDSKGKMVYLSKLSVVFQNPFSSLDPKKNVLQIIAEPLRTIGIHSRRDLLEKVTGLLQLVDLLPDQHVYRYPHEFSGGQRQRIAIARAIALNPELLILDEPTSALDVSVQAKIVNLLATLQRQLNMTYIFISHNIALVKHVCTKIGIMYRGRLLEVIDSDRLLEHSTHPYTRYLLEAVPNIVQENHIGVSRHSQPSIEKRDGEDMQGCPFEPKCYRSISRCKEVFPNRVNVGSGIVYCHNLE